MRPAAACVAQRRADLAGLAQVEAVERLVGQQQRMRREHADGEHARASAALSTACRSARSSSGPSSSRSMTSSRLLGRRPAAEEPEREVERPARPSAPATARCRRADRRSCDARSRGVERPSRRCGSVPASYGSTPAMHSNSVVLPEPFGPISAEHFALADRERHVRDRGQPAVRLREPVDRHHGPGHAGIEESLSVGGYATTSGRRRPRPSSCLEAAKRQGS